MDFIREIECIASKYGLTYDIIRDDYIHIKNHKNDCVEILKMVSDDDPYYVRWRICTDIIPESIFTIVLSKWLDKIVENKSKIAIDYIENIMCEYNIRYTRGDNFMDFQHNGKLGEIIYTNGYYRARYGKLLDGVTCNLDSVVYNDYGYYAAHAWDESQLDEGLEKVIAYLIG